MQSVPLEVRNSFNAPGTKVRPGAIIDIDHNISTRCAKPGTRLTSLDEKYFPPESALDLKYVSTGLPKGVVGVSRISSQSSAVQWRIAGMEDAYNYWISGGETPFFYVSYDNEVWSNAVFVRLEESWANAPALTIAIDTTLGEQLINFTPDGSGSYHFFYDGTSWGTSYVPGEYIQIQGVSVSSLVAAPIFLLHLGAHLFLDVSERIADLGINKNQEENDPIIPIGFGSANRLSMTLENSDGMFSPENMESMLYGLSLQNAVVFSRIDYFYQDDWYPIPQGVYYVNSFGMDAPGVEVFIDADDVSSKMQETFIGDFFLRDYNVDEIVRDLAQRGGFQIEISPGVRQDTELKYFWHEKDMSVWAALKELATATLSYLVAQEDGTLYWSDASEQSPGDEDTTLDATDDIVDIKYEYPMLANKINVNYNVYDRPYDRFAEEYVTQELWSSDSDEVLLASPLADAVGLDTQHVVLDVEPIDHKLWPDTGIIAIGEDVLRYSGKEVVGGEYRLTGLEPHENHPDRNVHFLGDLGSPESDGTMATRSRYRGHMRIAPGSVDYNTHNYSIFGVASDQWMVYGTRLMFPIDGGSTEIGGLTWHYQNVDNCYHAMISTTNHANTTPHPPDDAVTHELKVYKIVGGVRQQLTNVNDVQLEREGYAMEIDAGLYYDIEVFASYTAAVPSYSVFVNGRFIASFTDNQWTQGRYGVYAKGSSTIDFLHVYASSPDTSQSSVQFGSESSGWANAGYFLNLGDNGVLHQFSPFARQVREYSVDFSKYPVESSALLMSNKWQVVARDYISGPFGAKFTLENVSPGTAVLNGASRIFVEPVQMYLLSYGYPIVIKSEERKSYMNKNSIRRFGIKELEVSSPWIQTESMAERVADYIIKRFSSREIDRLSVQINQRPELQVGDVVALEYSEYGYMVETHYYAVTSIDINWAEGLGMNLELSRLNDEVDSCEEFVPEP